MMPFLILHKPLKSLMILVLCISLQAGLYLRAALLVVNTPADSGYGSFRWALITATKGDTILFDTAVFLPTSPVTINLTSAMLPAIVQGNLIIDASNAGVIIDGSSLSTGDGVHIFASDSNTVLGLDIRNFHNGISIAEGCNYNLVGGRNPGEANIVSSNSANGISVGNMGIGNSILSNSIFSNSNLGIDLGNDGPTPNDPGDADMGANNLQNFPEISTATININGDLIIDYLVDSDSTYSAYPLTVQFFKSDTTGQGKVIIGEDYYSLIDYSNGGKTVSLGNAANLGIVGRDSLVSTVTDSNGNSSEFSVIEIITKLKMLQSNERPENFNLAQNYPNPFNPTTTIQFDLPKISEVSLKVFNILGEKVTTLVSDKLSAGSYSYEWDASNLASGVYLYRLVAKPSLTGEVEGIV
jgi:hypothetical protein